jgi:hypothetical protein
MFRKHHSTTSRIARLVTSAVIGLVLLLVAGNLARLSLGQVYAQSAPLALDSTVTTTTTLNLRDQPSMTGSTVATMQVNARAIVIGGPFNDYWYWLDFEGTTGYALGRYLVVVYDNNTTGPTVEVTATSAPQQPPPVATVPATPPSEQTSATPQQTVFPQASPSPTSEITTPQTPGDYTGLWLGEMAAGGNVRGGPGLDKPLVKSWWAGRRLLLYQAAPDSKGDIWYRVSEPPEPPMWVHSSLVRKVAPVKFESARYKGRWVNVNLSQQIVAAYENDKPVMVTLTSTGKKKYETTVGTWKIYWRLPKQTMEGGNLASGDHYKLKDVPYPQYFHVSGEALHGTFWHDNFGRPMSHGCVNLSTPIAGWLYSWANIGTIVYVHY